MLVMLGSDEEIVGEIEFPIASYLTGFDLSYLIFGPEHQGKGYAKRKCWFDHGAFHDLQVWPMLREELPSA